MDSRSRPSECTAIKPPRVKKLICLSVSIGEAPRNSLSSSRVLNLLSRFSATTVFKRVLHFSVVTPVASVPPFLSSCLNP